MVCALQHAHKSIDNMRHIPSCKRAFIQLSAIISFHDQLLNLFVNCNLKSKTSVRLNGNVAYIDLESKEVPSSACGWQYSVTGMVQQTLGWGIRTMVQGG